jgi:outer membrane biosynthesis protein TonB
MMHALLFAVVLVARCGGEPKPLIKPEDVIMVAMDGPAKQVTAMPQKAERAPDPPSGAEPQVEPPPPNPSDMAFHDKDAPKPKGDPDKEKTDAKRDQLLAEMRRKALLDNLDAPVGKEDRAATSPDGTSSEGGTASAGVNDPALAKWVREAHNLLQQNFHPIPAYCEANPKLKAVAKVPVAGDGRLDGDPVISVSSGNPSIDAACLRAFTLTPRFPPTPPNRPNGLTTLLSCECNT